MAGLQQVEEPVPVLLVDRKQRSAGTKKRQGDWIWIKTPGLMMALAFSFETLSYEVLDFF